MRKLAFVMAMLLAGLLLVVTLRRSTEDVGPVATSPTRSPAVQSPELETPASPPPHRLRGEVQDGATSEPLVDDASDSKAAELKVQVVSSDSGAPLPDVEVELVARKSGDYVEESTDDEGLATFDAVVDEALELHVPGDRGRHGARELALEPLEAGEIRSVVLPVPTALGDASFFGRVVRAEDGAALPGARVSLVDPEWPSSLDTMRMRTKGRARVTPDANGLFEVSYTAWDPPSGRVELAGYASAAFDLVAGFDQPERPAEIRMLRPGSVEVTVLDRGGGALSGVEVRLSVSTARFASPKHPNGDWWTYETVTWSESTDVQGACTLTGLVPEQRLRVLLVHGGAEHDIAQSLRVEPGETKRVEYRLGSDATVRGILIDQDGQAVASQVVWLARGPGTETIWAGIHYSAFASAETDVQGRFRFDNVPPGDWFVGPASTRDESDDPAGAELVAQVTEPVHVATHQEEVELVLRRQRGLYIRGVVLGPNGGAVAGSVSVRAWRPSRSSPWDILGKIRTDEAGQFVLGPLPAGQLLVVASGWSVGEAESQPVLASAGDEGVVLQLRAGASLRGKVVDDLGVIRDAELTVIRSPPAFDGDDLSWGSAGGEGFELEGLEAGRFSILAQTPDGLAGCSEALRVEAGQSLDGIVVQLQQAAVVRVTHARGERALEFRIAGQLVQRGWIDERGTVEYSLPPGPVLVRMLEDGEGSPVQERTVDAPRGSVVEVTFD